MSNLTPSSDQSRVSAGSFQEITGFEVVRKVLWASQSGRLAVHRGDDKKVLYFAHGLPIGARSNSLDETLLRLAVRYKVIDAAIEKNILKELDQGTTTTQEILLLEAGVTQASLKALQAKQNIVRFANVCTWEDGVYVWKEGLPKGHPKWNINPVQIFVDFIKLWHRPQHFEQIIEQYKPLAIQIDHEKLLRFEPYGLEEKRTRPLVQQLDAHAGMPTEQLIAAVAEQSDIQTWLGLAALVGLGILHLEEATQKHVEQAPPPTREQEPASQPTAKLDELGPLLAELENKNHFELLELELDATTKDIKRAYLQKAKQYHPDRYKGNETVSTETLETIFALINQAYDVLRDDRERETYLHFLKKGTTPEVEVAQAESILSSEVEFQKGKIMLKRRNYNGALDHLRQAVQLNQDEQEYKIYLYWCEFLQAYPDHVSTYNKSFGALKTLLNGGIRSADGWYFLARMHKITGDLEEAQRALKKTLSLQSSYSDAQNELRRIEKELQQMQENNKFSKLFNKS